MLTKKEVQHIADLARLGLDDKEIEEYRKELSSILDYIEALNKVEVEGVEATSHPGDLKNVIREDRAKKKDEKTAGKLLEAAPDKENGYVKVKSILH